MHELSITQALLDQVIRHAGAAQADRVSEIHIRIGQLSSIVDDSVQFYWPIIAKDTIAAGARLVIERVPAQFICAGCGQTFLFNEQRDYLCPHCGSMDVMLTGGEEMQLESIQIERDGGMMTK
jgi:hydrogenase nickel incorporation protein HypA/HybF